MLQKVYILLLDLGKLKSRNHNLAWKTEGANISMVHLECNNNEKSTDLIGDHLSCLVARSYLASPVPSQHLLSLT